MSADNFEHSGGVHCTDKGHHIFALSLGGLGLRSATRTSLSAWWASWADTLPMIHARHPDVATMILHGLNHEAQGPNVRGVADAVRMLTGVEGFEPPSWEALLDGARPPPHDPEDHEPGGTRGGWQHEAASRVERNFRDRRLMPVMSRADQALLRSQSGPFAGMALSAASTNALSRISPQLFRVLLLRRLRLPLPLCSRACRCALHDCFGHHRAACSRAGVLGRRGYAVESAATRVCREAGARVTTNVMIRDMDLPVPEARGGRRIEIVADGLPLFGGAPLAVDVTLVSPLHCDGSPVAGADVSDGAVLVAARRRKERTYPELVGPRARARLVVLAGEVGGRWSQEVNTFVRLLARAKARSEPSILRRRVEQAWRLRWGTILACSAVRAFASSLLDVRTLGGLMVRSHHLMRS